MNPYAMIGSAVGTAEAASLCARLSAWHDAMVAHERRMRTDDCDSECPHAEARVLWPEAVATFGPRADQLAFLRTRAKAPPRQATVHDTMSRAADSGRRTSHGQRPAAEL